MQPSPPRADTDHLPETQALIKSKRRCVHHAHAQMRARRTAPAKFVHDLIEHAPAVAASLCAHQQINVQVRRVSLVWLGREVIGVVIPVINGLHPRPLARLAVRCGKSFAQIRPPLFLVAREKRTRIKRSQRVAADALSVFQDETQFRLVGEIGADKNPTQSVGVFAVKRLAVLAEISRLQTNVISARLIAGASGTNGANIHDEGILAG